MDSVHLTDIDTLVLCGGGISGISYVGALETLYRDMYFDFFSPKRLLKRIIGVSVGAIFGLIVTCGLSSINEMQTMLQKFVQQPILKPNPITFVQKWGADQGKEIKTVLCSILKSKGIDPDTNFADLKRITRVSFEVSATNISKHKTVYFSAKSSPDMRVLDAVMMSAALPPFFAPIHHDGEVYIDGCIMNSIPLIPPINDTTTMILRITNPREATVNTLPRYLGQLIKVVLNAHSIREVEQLSPELAKRTITIDCGDISVFDFNMSNVTNKKLLLFGINAAEKFISDHNVVRFFSTREVGTQTDDLLQLDSPLVQEHT